MTDRLGGHLAGDSREARLGERASSHLVLAKRAIHLGVVRDVPHVAAIVADRDGILYEGGAGVRIAGGSDDPVTTSTQFRIMSMTKMVCTVAALQQIKRGELDLDAPVDSYCPEFAGVVVLEGSTGTRRGLSAAASLAGCNSGFCQELPLRTLKITPKGDICADASPPPPGSSMTPDGITVWLDRGGPAHANDAIILERLALAVRIRHGRGGP